MVDFQVSIYSRAHDKTSTRTLSFADVINAIKTGTIKNRDFKPAIHKIRLAPDAVESKRLKTNLPGVTFSGTFSERSQDNLLQHSGYICLDFDHVDAIADVKQQLYADKHTYIGFVSPSGTGIKLVVNAPADAASHKTYFAALEQYFLAQYGLVVDTSGKDVSRLCFLSYDAEIFVNAKAVAFQLVTTASEVKAKPTIVAMASTAKNAGVGSSVDSAIVEINNAGRNSQPKPAVPAATTTVYDQVEHCIFQIEEKQLDITTGYDNWLSLAFALANEFGETGRGFYQRLSMYYPGYDAADTDSKYTNAVNTNNGKVTIRTFFDACKKAGINIKLRNYLKTTSQKGNNNAEITGKKQENIPEKMEKISEKPIGKGISLVSGGNDAAARIANILTIHRANESDQATEINIVQHKFYELLVALGYRRFDIDANSSVIVKVVNNVIEQVNPVVIQDNFFKLIEQLPDELEKNNKHVPKSVIKEKFTKGSDTYFNSKKLTHLRNDKPFDMCEDGREYSYIFFENGFVKCGVDGYTLQSYNAIDGYIWKAQKINRVFTSLPCQDVPPQGMFTSFLHNVCGGDTDRLKALCTLIGYLLHGYYDYKLKAVVFTDSEITDAPNGRTGKTLILQALEKVKPAVIINGKNFKPDHQFKYQDVNPDTSIVALNDVRRHFNVEDMFNDISDGLTVEKKNQKPFKTKAKMVIATNMTLKTEGASASDRFIDFEFSNHYSDTRSPKDDFGKWFFTEWSDEEWNDFYNLMAYCICSFLKTGIITPSGINIDRRRLIDHTNEDFVTWMDEQVQTERIKAGSEYIKTELYSAFIQAYPDYSEKNKRHVTQRTFTGYLVRYINLSGHFAKFEKQYDSRRTNGSDLIKFRGKPDDINIADLPF